VLRLTQRNDMPDDVRQLHRQVEARALIQLNLVSSAFDALDGDVSRASNYLRADAYWRSKQWTQLERIYRQLFAQDGDRLSATDQRQVLRWAYALTMQNAQKSSRDLATRFGADMAKGKFAQAFAVLTSGNQTSTADINRIAPALAEIDQLQDLMPLYKLDPVQRAAPRQRQAAGALSLPNQG
jgi:hypothetical protein